MNSFTLTAVGNLAKNPEVIATGEIAQTRFWLVGNDYAGQDENRRPQYVVTTAQFVALGEIAVDIAKKAKKGDQLVLEARISHQHWTKEQDVKRIEAVFIVTGFRYGAKKGGPCAADTADSRAPRLPRQPATEAAAMTA